MSHRAQDRARSPIVAAILASLMVGVAACDDDPFAFDWNDAPDTVLLYSLARPELNLVSAFNFLNRTPIQVESPASTGAWDVAVDTRGGQIALLPPGALGVLGTARITELAGISFSDVLEAPIDTLVYSSDQPLVVRQGSVYVIRTNRQPGPFGTSCSYYAKMEPITIDPAGGTLVFRHVTNPTCNNRDLVPPN